MTTRDLLQQLRDKGWGDSALAEALGIDRATVFRWRTGGSFPSREKEIYDTLRRLLRRAGPPPRKDVAGASPATCVASASPTEPEARLV
jgi:hypothetical protein